MKSEHKEEKKDQQPKVVDVSLLPKQEDDDAPLALIEYDFD